MNIGVLIIATGRYREFIDPLLESMREHLLPKHRKTYFVFSDQPIKGASVIWHKVPHLAWPGPAMQQYKLIADQKSVLSKMDYLLYCDADMLFINSVGEEILGDLMAVRHPWFDDSPRSAYTYETRSESTACVQENEGVTYFAGALQGGTPQHYLVAAAQMSANIIQDETHGITAIWHDESHWNRYLIDHPPTVELPKDYCCPQSIVTPEARILTLDKDADAMRAHPDTHANYIDIKDHGPFRVFEGKHPQWSGPLHLFENGRLYRPWIDEGTYEIEEEKRLILNWDRWPAEKLEWDNINALYCNSDKNFTLKEHY